MKELKACGVLVVRGDADASGSVSEVLLMKHADRWDLPKGHMEPGETERGCALRELAEETGLTERDIALDEGFRWTIQYPVNYRRTEGETFLKTVVIFLGWLKKDREIVCTEHEGYRWWSWPTGPIQTQTIDPLLASVAEFLDR